jgi:hypothetical protein
VFTPIPSNLALCEKEKIDDAEEEARLMARRRQFCRVLVPESEEKRDQERSEMETIYDQASTCWYNKAATCPHDRRSEAKMMGRELKVNLELNNREIDSIPKPKRGLARAEKDGDKDDLAETKHKRFNILWQPLEEPYPENTQYSFEYCEKQREFIKWYHKALRSKITACNETRAFYDCQRDAFSRFRVAYTESYADCQEFNCEL